MRVDMYRRPEVDNKFSHLAVPEGKPIPQEAINVDWQAQQRGLDLDESAAQWADYGIEQPGSQIEKKGYAITSVQEQTPD